MSRIPRRRRREFLDFAPKSATLAARRSKDMADLDQALATLRSLDIEAFRNLVDPEEEIYLRARLPARVAPPWLTAMTWSIWKGVGSCS